MRSLWVARCFRILGLLWWQKGHFQRPPSNSVGKVLPLLWNAGQEVSIFLFLAGEEQGRGDSRDCGTLNKTVNNMRVTVSSREVLSWGSLNSWFSGFYFIKKNWRSSILKPVTSKLLRFLAGLSAGLTVSAAATGGEERRGDFPDCETWGKTFNDMKFKLCSRELLRLSKMVIRAATGLERDATFQ